MNDHSENVPKNQHNFNDEKVNLYQAKVISKCYGFNRYIISFNSIQWHSQGLIFLILCSKLREEKRLDLTIVNWLWLALGDEEKKSVWVFERKTSHIFKAVQFFNWDKVFNQGIWSKSSDQLTPAKLSVMLGCRLAMKESVRICRIL